MSQITSEKHPLLTQLPQYNVSSNSFLHPPAPPSPLMNSSYGSIHTNSSVRVLLQQAKKRPEKIHELIDFEDAEDELRRLSPSDRTSQILLLVFISFFQCMGSVAYGYNSGKTN